MAKVTSTEEWCDAVKRHIEKLTSEDERYDFAHNVIFDVALWCGYSGYETIGLLELVKADLIKALDSIPSEED